MLHWTLFPGAPLLFLTGYVISQNIRPLSAEEAMPRIEFAFPAEHWNVVWSDPLPGCWDHYHRQSGVLAFLDFLGYLTEEETAKGVCSGTPWACMVELSFVFEERKISEDVAPQSCQISSFCGAVSKVKPSERRIRNYCHYHNPTPCKHNPLCSWFCGGLRQWSPPNHKTVLLDIAYLSQFR